MMKNPCREKGATLIDTIVATSLLLVVFVGIAAAFQLSVEVVSNNKARAGAIALSNERMELIRSLPYDSVGTVGGIPAGVVEQSETINLNGVSYTRRTVIVYQDDPLDGEGAFDSNGIETDYKSVKVDVTWQAKNGTARTVTLVTRRSPPGLEQAVPGGTLVIHVIDSNAASLEGAEVLVVNALTSPPINTTMYTDASGEVRIIGAPDSAGYEVTTTKGGYSTAQTYAATSENTNPDPGHLTVNEDTTTSATFAIDALSTKVVRTYSPIDDATTSDSFSDAHLLALMTDVEVSGGSIVLAGGVGAYETSGYAGSEGLGTSTPITAWRQATWQDVLPSGTSVTYRIYDGTGTNLVPDAQVPGNSTGLVVSPVSLAAVSTSTYQTLSLRATLGTSDLNVTPEVLSWAISYDTGPIPLQNIEFSLQGTKTIGSGPNGIIYKFATSSVTTGTSSVATISDLEWDTYMLTVASTTGYDIASSCTPQPEYLSPGTTQETRLVLEPHTTNSLLVDVRTASGDAVAGPTIRLYRVPGYDTTRTGDSCGQTLFPSLSTGSPGSGNAYSISVSAPGYTTYNASNVTVSGSSRLSVTLNP